MAVNYRETPAGQLQAIDGIRLFVGQAGIKKPQHDDLTLIQLSDGSTVGAVFTQNRFCAAPVRICKQHLFDADGVRALVINTGNANAGTGEEGCDRAMAVCEAAAEQAGCALTQVLPFSTGVILEPLPADKIIAALPKLRPAGWADAARAIMTTDTVPKSASREGSEIDNIADPRYKQLKDLLCGLALELAQAIVRDGEGATKFITIEVCNAESRDEARRAAYAVARSPLVKTAFFASDPNLGRLLAAVGCSGVDLDCNTLKMWLNGVLVAEKGGRAAGYTEEQGQAVMNESEITVRIDLQRGREQAAVYTCDLSHEYVSINADYRS